MAKLKYQDDEAEVRFLTKAAREKEMGFIINSKLTI